jgi:hypothetical protein
MQKQAVLNECARRLGDMSAGFLAILSTTFDFVVLELAQHGVLSTLTKESAFLFSAGTPSNGILNFSTRTITGLAAPLFPSQINKLIVPAWGAPWGKLTKASDDDFETQWLAYGTAYTDRPHLWRVYPNPTQLQVWPVAQADFASASCLVEHLAPPATLNDGDEIVEVLIEDIPTLLAGLYRHGLKFQDETIRDMANAEAMWVAGLTAMRQRQVKAQFSNRPVQIRIRDF